MKSGPKPLGFTIIETLIVLAVSSAILVSALGLVAGSQNKTEFTQAINDIDQVINDTANNVANGYYANIGGLSTEKCKADTTHGEPTFSGSGSGQGTNDECIFLGRILQFHIGKSDYYIHNVVGLRVDSNNNNVTDIVGALPRIIEPDTMHSDMPHSTENKLLKNGLVARSVKYVTTDASAVTTTKDTTSVGFFNRLATDDAASPGNLQNTGLDIDFGPIGDATPTSVPNIKSGFVSDFYNDSGSTASVTALKSNLNPNGGLTICFDNGAGSSRHARIIIGGAGRRVATKIEYGGTPC